ncbi:MAG: ABC transporter permease, partial [Candidatus Sericytochromatia bacterium]
MTLIEQILTVWRALWTNKMRSLLTLLGVMMGVGTIVLLSSLIAGGLASITRTVESASGEDVITVSVDRWDPKGWTAPRLKPSDMQALSRAAGLEQATVLPQLDARLDARSGGERMRVRVVGTNERAMGFYQLELASGRFLTSLDRTESRRVAVIGQEVAKGLGLSAPHFGELHLGGERFQVVGLLSKKPTLNIGNQTWNNAVAIPDSTFMAWKGQAEIDTILVKTNQVEDLHVTLGLATHTVRSILEARHHPAETLQVKSTQDRSSGEKGFLQALSILMYAVAILCLGVGGINIMNIMLVTVTERTREIGIRMALGARQRDIRRQFLIEAAAVSSLGGLLGVLGGVGLGWGI